MATEIRMAPGGVRARPGDAGKMPTFEGRAIVYNSRSAPLSEKRIGKFYEIILPGAVRKTMAGRAEVLADVNHESDQIIGRRSRNTLVMTDGPEGLDVEISPPDTSWARDAAAAVDHGDYSGMSFQFTVNGDGERFYRDANGNLVRELSDINLERVSVVGEPAYPATEVTLRSVEAAQRALAEADGASDIVAACAASVV